MSSFKNPHTNNGCFTAGRGADAWIRETRIGTWFLGTDMWRRHVLPGTIEEMERLLNGHYRAGRLLDIGCGQGFAFPLLDRHFRPEFLLGIDIDSELVARAAALVEGCSCKAEIRIGNAARLDLPDCAVDTVFCHQSFHHLAEQEMAAREFFRVLVPGGRLLFAESCRSFIYSWWVRLFFRHPMEVQKSADEYLSLLRSTGFQIGPQDVATPYPPWARPDFGLLEALGRPAHSQHAQPLIVVVAQRPI